MFASRFLFKLYASYAALVLGTTAFIGVLVHTRMERSLLAEVETTLRSKATLIAPYASRHFEGTVATQEEREMNRLARQSGVRITLILPDGAVAADSEEDPANMVNYADRPEVQSALARGSGVAQRYSETADYPMLYVAQKLRSDDGTLGIVRVAIPLRELQSQLRSMRATLALGAGFGVMAAMLVGILVARRITAPIRAMTETAEAMRVGRYESRVTVTSRDEIGVLGDTLNRLGSEVTKQIAALSQQRAQLQAIVAGMVEGVLAVDDEDRVLLCNRAATELLRLATDDVRGRRIWEVMRSAELTNLLGRAREGGPVRDEIVSHRGDPQRVLDAHLTTFEDGQTRGVVIVLHDISDLRRLERIRQDFVANVSHELKTPLTSIKGYVETLLGGALRDERNNVRFLQKVDRHVGRLTDLVQDLLSLARIESQQDRLLLKAVDCRPIVAEAVGRHEMAMQQKGLRCKKETNGSSTVVLGDAEAIRQILDNLLDNAVKYTPAQGEVGVSLHRNETKAYIHVEDTGIGIPKKDLDRVFERFYRVDRARSRELGGTGLGLSIVKHLAHAMNGEVQVESRLGRGTRFTLSLPLS